MMRYAVVSIATLSLAGFEVSLSSCASDAPPAPPTRTITKVTADGQAAFSGTTVLSPPTVLVRTISGVPVAGATVTFTIASGGGTITGGMQVTDSAGVATVGSWTVGTGANRLAATTPETSGVPIEFTANGLAASALTITLQAGNYDSSQAGYPVRVPPSVRVTDENGSSIPNVPVVFTVALGGGAITGGTARTRSDGVVALSSWTLGPGINNVTAAITDGPTVTFTAAGLVPNGLAVGNVACALMAGLAYCWGNNAGGQLGDGTTTNSDSPVAVGGALKFQSLTVGQFSSCGLTAAGKAYCWGHNAGSGLGSFPAPVPGNLTFQSLSSGAETTCGLTTGGVAYCWGLDNLGEFGNADSADSSVPTLAGGGMTFASLSTNTTRSCGLTPAGVAYCWGLGSLGNGSTIPRFVPTPVSGGLTFQRLSLAGDHTCGITTNGAAYCWGAGGFGALGNNSYTESLIPVAVTGGFTFQDLTGYGYFSCGVTADRAGYCWGFNDDGNFGSGTTGRPNFPVRAGGAQSFQSLAAGQTWRGSGSHFACGQRIDGVLLCWGSLYGVPATPIVPTAVRFPPIR